ncbi:MAG: DUF4149 domain-containing protein [Bacillota bacterium]
MRYLESITQLAMALWVGSAAGFAMAAPRLFRAFGPDRQAAGDLAGEIIFQLNQVGVALGAVALLALLPRLRRGLNRWRALLLGGALALALTTWFYIFPQLEAAQPPRPIQEYAQTAPERVAYSRWHELSERVYGTAMLLGAGVIFLGPLGREERS